MHTIKITADVLFEYQCTIGKFISLANRIESKKSIRWLQSNRIEYNLFSRIGMLYCVEPPNIVDDRALYPYAGAAPLTQNIAADTDHKLPTVPRSCAVEHGCRLIKKNTFRLHSAPQFFESEIRWIRGERGNRVEKWCFITSK